MNSLDDPLDERLRKQFQQVFDDYAVTPPTSLKARIWRRLPEAPHRRYVAYCLLLTGVLFPVSSQLFVRPTVGGQGIAPPVSSRTSVSITSQRKMPVGNAIAPPEVESDGRAVDRPVTRTAPHRNLTPAEPDTGALTSHRRVVVAADRLVSERPVMSDRGQADGSVTATASADRGRWAVRRTSVGGLPAIVPAPGVDVREPGETALPTPASGESTPVTPTANGDESERLLIPALRLPTRSVPASGLTAGLTRPVLFTSARAASAIRPVARRTELSWFVRAAALNTYQQMTVVTRNGLRVGHVVSPSAWSGQTWGYQFSGGISWHRWDAYVSYGQIRRWAYYDLVTDEYQVEPVGTNGYQVTRRVESVAENVALPLLGVGLSKQFTLGRHQRYYARLGGQYTYVSTTQQSLGWAQASWGLNLPLGRAHQVQVGPAIDYSLNRLWSTERQLLIHPYTVGVSLTLRPNTFLTK